MSPDLAVIIFTFIFCCPFLFVFSCWYAKLFIVTEKKQTVKSLNCSGCSTCNSMKEAITARDLIRQLPGYMSNKPLIVSSHAYDYQPMQIQSGRDTIINMSILNPGSSTGKQSTELVLKNKKVCKEECCNETTNMNNEYYPYCSWECERWCEEINTDRKAGGYK